MLLGRKVMGGGIVMLDSSRHCVPCDGSIGYRIVLVISDNSWCTVGQVHCGANNICAPCTEIM
jgi:hypothetical protein